MSPSAVVGIMGIASDRVEARLCDFGLCDDDGWWLVVVLEEEVCIAVWR